MQFDGAIAEDGLVAVDKLIFVHRAYIARAAPKSYFPSAKAALYAGLTAASNSAVTGKVSS